MSSKTIQAVVANMEKFLYNPAAVQSVILDLTVEALGDGSDVVDASNPFVMLLEASAINAAAFVNRDQRSVRRSYALAAQTEEELYLHMSDKDYVDRFALPSRAKFFFFLNKAELLDKMVLDPVTGIRKVTIPRNSYITISDTVFSLEYPVDIRVLNHGGLQVIYDAEKTSPTKTLPSNLITWQVITTDTGAELLGFELEFSQFQISEYKVVVKASTLVKEKIALKAGEKFYYCRVFMELPDGDLEEISTTHTDSVYDINNPTAVLQVFSDHLTVKIPQIYVDNGLNGKRLIVFVYTTKGKIDIPLKSYSSDLIEKTFYSIFPNEQNEFSAPLPEFRQWIIQARTNTIGGQDAMTFSELMTRVKTNSVGSPVIPITPAQITSSLNRPGYNVVKNIDNIANRTYLATRSMPEPQNSDLITAAAAGVGTLSTRISDILGRDTVIDNGDLVTILPGTLYKIESGLLSIVTEAELDALNALPSDQRALVISRRNYYYTPFYYVLDTSRDEFAVRVYHLDSPEIINRSFVMENDSSGFQVSLGSINVERTSYGYRVLIGTKSSENWKALDDEQVNVQLAIRPNGTSDHAYVNGILLGKTQDLERIYELRILTNSAIDSDHRMTVSNFTMFSDDPRNVQMDLDSKCEILFTTDAAPQSNWSASQIDSVLGYHLLSENSYGLTHESFTLITGKNLKYLWSRARSTVSEADYVRWPDNVPAVYEDDVLAVDPDTGAKFQIIGGEIVKTVLYHKNDPILDGGGNPVYKYYKGEVKSDEYGNPLIANPRSLLRQIDIVLIEGVYMFATDNTALTYRQQLTSEMVEWITEELPSMGASLLENTELFLQPTSSIGNVDVVYGASLETTIDAGQSFQVVYHVRPDVHSNPSLRAAIEKKTIRIIGDALKNAKVAMSDISDSLKDASGDDILSVSIKGLGGERNLDMLTVIDDARRLSIKKRLINRSDEVLFLQEAVDVEFVRHTTT